MSAPRQIVPGSTRAQSTPLGSVSFRIPVTLDNTAIILPDGTTGYRVFYGQNGGCIEKFRVLEFKGYCTAAGAGVIYAQRYRWSDTSGGSGIIIDSLNLAILADTDNFENAQIDDTYNVIDPGQSDELQIVISSGTPLAQCWFECEMVE